MDKTKTFLDTDSGNDTDLEWPESKECTHTTTTEHLSRSSDLNVHCSIHPIGDRRWHSGFSTGSGGPSCQRSGIRIPVRAKSIFIAPLCPPCTKWVARSLKIRRNPQQGDLRLSGPPSGQGAGGGARTCDRRVPADLRAESQATVPPKPQIISVCVGELCRRMTGEHIGSKADGAVVICHWF
ncbi:hypothetical protein PoB_004815100 [Plakobranchus ocellatus]|uniref:Uncharacterized protein n=1 Tax=Plakobranchus ocellatus TaxID=259542 RepID=A0AAV4BRF7_9GAST|nr:hypothetical protein PoB_004815100 [Plakobranchus ocellatus]